MSICEYVAILIKCDCLKVVEKRLRLQYNLGSGVFTIFSREVGFDGGMDGWMDKRSSKVNDTSTDCLTNVLQFARF